MSPRRHAVGCGLSAAQQPDQYADIFHALKIPHGRHDLRGSLARKMRIFCASLEFLHDVIEGNRVLWTPLAVIGLSGNGSPILETNVDDGAHLVDSVRRYPPT